MSFFPLLLAVLAAAPVPVAAPGSVSVQPAGAGADAVPRLLNCQGRLTDSLGQPVADTVHDLRFRLYADSVGGAHLWEEEQSVRTDGGLLSVLLGSVEPLLSVPERGELYLGMAVNRGEELVPRVRIASTVYALRADTADYALASAGGDAWVRGRPDSVLFTVRQLGIARGGAQNALEGDSVFTHTNLGVACTTGMPGFDLFGCTVGGGFINCATDAYATVAGGGGNRAEASYATVGGGAGNKATGSRATVAGGRENQATGTNATVSGGKYTIASGYCAAIGGGLDNIASGSTAGVGGGSGNIAAGDHAAIAGGFGNRAEGFASSVPGGFLNGAGGYGSLAAGTCARAKHAGCFVWGDSAASSEDSVFATGSDQFRVRARGGTWFFSDGAMTTGAYLAAGSNSWASACDSATKEDFRDVDRQELLEKVAALRVRDYRMRDQQDGTRHIGPVAQDFAAAFGYGETNTSINLADADGVLLAAVQALYEQNRALARRVAELERRPAGH